MSVNRIWAPWRINYISAMAKKHKRCIFCRMLKEKNDRDNLIFVREKHGFAVLNIYPYNNGHSLIVAYRHVKDMGLLNREERNNLFDLMDFTQVLLRKVIKPEGFNIGMNIGKIAGAGCPGHIHIHVVPRWHGDVNFMPVTADTKVISQSLQALYDELVKGCRRLKKR